MIFRTNPECIGTLFKEGFDEAYYRFIFYGFGRRVFPIVSYCKEQPYLFSAALFSGALALVFPLISLRNNRSKKYHAVPKHICTQDADVHLPSNPKVIYRVRNGNIYKGMDVAPICEIRGDKIYTALSSKPVYHIKNSKVYRGSDATPILEIKGSKIYYHDDSRVKYELLNPKGM